MTASTAEPGAAPAGIEALAARWPEAVLLGVAVLTPVVYYLSHLALAVVVALAGLLCLPLLFRKAARGPLIGLGFLLALCGWALASMNWSIFTQGDASSEVSLEDMTALKMLLEIGLYGAFVAAATTLSSVSARRVSQAFAIGLLALAALFFLEGLVAANIYAGLRDLAGQPVEPAIAMRDVKRVAYLLAVTFWPVAIWLEGGRFRWAAPAMAAATFIGSMRLGGEAAAAALVVSAAVFFAVRRFGRPALWACLAGVCLYFIATPLLVNAVLPPGVDAGLASDPETVSWAIRLDIWRFAAERALERPFLGWGLDASRMFSPDIQLHTHNGALQLWLELGAVGAGFAALFFAWLFVRLDEAEEIDRSMTAAAAATATAYLVIGALSFGVWQEWWVAMGALAAAMCVVGFRARRGMAAGSGLNQGREPKA